MPRGRTHDTTFPSSPPPDHPNGFNHTQKVLLHSPNHCAPIAYIFNAKNHLFSKTRKSTTAGTLARSRGGESGSLPSLPVGAPPPALATPLAGTVGSLARSGSGSLASLPVGAPPPALAAPLAGTVGSLARSGSGSLASLPAPALATPLAGTVGSLARSGSGRGARRPARGQPDGHARHPLFVSATSLRGWDCWRRLDSS